MADDKFDLGPAAALAAAVVAAIGNITGFASAMGIGAFACDLVGAMTFAIAAIYWAKRSWDFSTPKRVAGFVGGAAATRRQWRTVSLAQAAGALVLLGIALWFAFPVAHKAIAPTWRICGTVQTKCPSTYCTTGLDDRHRQTSSACVAPRDVSGYLVLESSDWTTYRPEYLRFQCEGKEIGEAKVPENFSNARCDAFLAIP